MPPAVVGSPNLHELVMAVDAAVLALREAVVSYEHPPSCICRWCRTLPPAMEAVESLALLATLLEARAKEEWEGLSDPDGGVETTVTDLIKAVIIE